MLDRTTFVVVSDHGFKMVKEQIRLNSLLGTGAFDAGVQAIPEGGSAMIYVDRNRQSELLPKLEALFTGTEGVEMVADASKYQALGLPSPEKDRQSPDLVVFAKSGYAFVGGKKNDAAVAPVEQPGGSHGYLNTDPELNAIFIASGYGIRSGVVLDEIRNLSVAPTLARLLDVQLPKTEAPALDEIFK